MDYDDFFTSKKIEGNPIKLIDLGNLYVPTGKLVTCDPFLLGDAPPFTRAIPTGEYKVVASQIDLKEEGGKRIHAIKLIVSDVEAVKWKNAYGKKNMAFSVDGGMACICDAETQEFCDAYLREFYKTNSEPMPYPILNKKTGNIKPWLDFKIPGHEKNNVIMFESGTGDGHYSPYWGIDAAGEICSLVIDFEILSRMYTEEAKIDPTKIANKDLPIWHTIELGTYASTNELVDALLKNDYKISGEAIDLLKQMTVAPRKTNVPLIKVTPKNLGLMEDPENDRYVTMRQFYEAAENAGYDMVPAEVGPQLRLASALSDNISSIGMKPLRKADGKWGIFKISDTQTGKWLLASEANPNIVINEEAALLFTRRSSKS